MYVTTNSGVNWNRVGNMPIIPVFDLVIDYKNNRLVAGTFAQSMQSFPIDSIIDTPILVGINHEKSKQNFVVYPNPATSFINIRTDKTITSLRLFSINGQEILLDKPLNLTQLSIPSLKRGVYILTITDESQTTTSTKFLKL